MTRQIKIIPSGVFLPHLQDAGMELKHSLIRQRDHNLDEIEHFEKEHKGMISNSRFYAAAEIAGYIKYLQRKNVDLDARITQIANQNILKQAS